MIRRHEGAVCEKCGDYVFAVLAPGAEIAPGDVSLCIGCGDLRVFDDELGLREPTEVEVAVWRHPSSQFSTWVLAIFRAKERTEVD
jgi:uncharacterized Zn finger protein